MAEGRTTFKCMQFWTSGWHRIRGPATLELLFGVKRYVTIVLAVSQAGEAFEAPCFSRAASIGHFSLVCRRALLTCTAVRNRGQGSATGQLQVGLHLAQYASM